MAFTRPTLVEIIARIESDMSSRLLGNAPILRRSMLGVLSRVFAGVVHMLYGVLSWVSKQIVPGYLDNDDDILEQHADTFGVVRNSGTYAVGTATCTGTNGAIIPSGTVFQTADGVQFATDAEYVIALGTVIITITAVEPGANGNAIAGTIISLTSSISGVNSEGVILSTAGGVDQESVDSLRARLESRLINPPHGGTKKDYEDWAKSVAGVSNAYCFPLYDYDNNISDIPGHVSVAITENNEPSSGALVTQVQDYFDTVAPVTAIATAFAPDTLSVNFALAITVASGYDQTTVEAAVEAELRDLFLREAAPGSTLPLSHIRESISMADGEFDFTMSAPTADIVSTKKQLPMVGTFTFS